jgi:hypothetical protein
MIYELIVPFKLNPRLLSPSVQHQHRFGQNLAKHHVFEEQQLHYSLLVFTVQLYAQYEILSFSDFQIYLACVPLKILG